MGQLEIEAPRNEGGQGLDPKRTPNLFPMVKYEDVRREDGVDQITAAQLMLDLASTSKDKKAFALVSDQLKRLFIEYRDVLPESFIEDQAALAKDYKIDLLSYTPLYDREKVKAIVKRIKEDKSQEVEVALSLICRGTGVARFDLIKLMQKAENGLSTWFVEDKIIEIGHHSEEKLGESKVIYEATSGGVSDGAMIVDKAEVKNPSLRDIIQKRKTEKIEVK